MDKKPWGTQKNTENQEKPALNSLKGIVKECLKFTIYHHLQVHIRSSLIINGVCVRWKGWIDAERLEGVGRIEFDEDMARVRKKRFSFSKESKVVYTCTVLQNCLFPALFIF